jgi:hypothetical protein
MPARLPASAEGGHAGEQTHTPAMVLPANPMGRRSRLNGASSFADARGICTVPTIVLPGAEGGTRSLLSLPAGVDHGVA